MGKIQGVIGVLLVVAVAALLGLFQHVTANRFSSPNYIIDASVGNSFGGASSSTNYKLVSSGGESIIGDGSGGSYKLGEGYVSQLQQSIQMTVQQAGLLAYYSFDEGAGTRVHDSTPNNHHADFSAGNPSTWNTSGQIGGSVTNGGDDHGILTTEADFGNPTAFTACAWLLPNTPVTNPTVVARSNGSTSIDGMWSLGLNGGSSARARLRLNGVTTPLVAPSAFTPGVWAHECMSYDGTTMRLYANGADVASETLNTALPAVSSVLSIGSMSNTSSANFPDPIDEVKYFSRALTAKEVKAEYDAGAAGNQAGISLNTITPGASQTADFTAVVQTDAPDYTLAANQNQDLTSGANTIPAVSGSIASPVTWSEGSTKGLGFTLVSTNATAIPGSWGSGNAYAAFPGSATTFYTRNGFTAGAKDYLNMRLRLDTNTSQATGDYSNVVTWTGTIIP